MGLYLYIMINFLIYTQYETWTHILIPNILEKKERDMSTQDEWQVNGNTSQPKPKGKTGRRSRQLVCVEG